MKYRILKHIFGYNEFRPFQESIVDAIVDGKDVLTIMPTGGGKSLCYQLPAIIRPGVCIVICPLLALMKDQVDAARENGIKAAYLNSTTSLQERRVIFAKLYSNDLDLLYVSPERLALGLLEKFKEFQISFFAIDEAHCISEWGHDFRPDYLVLSDLKLKFSDVPVTAFTASATLKVQKDIIKRLNLKDPFLVNASFDRPNLFYSVERKHHDDAFLQIEEFIKKQDGECGIIYRGTRQKVDDTAEYLKKVGINALPYHAGMASEQRKENQEKFSNDDVNVIVATIAFGMGIDKSNIRFILHAELPKNIESYYQETGRAGRDGDPALCTLLYALKDEGLQKYFIGQTEGMEEKQKRYKQLDAMVRFATSSICRRKTILNYFGEKYNFENCGACDICSGNMELVDITRDAQIVMSAILRTQEKCGTQQIIDIIRGSKSRKILELEYDQIKTYGAGRHLNKQEALFVIEQLIASGAVEKIHEEYERLVLTPKGRNVLFGKSKFSVLKKTSDDVSAKISDIIGKKQDKYDPMLFEELRLIRKELAEKHRVKPYMVFSDKVLREISYKMPVTKFEMLQVSGVGDTKFRQYGKTFINEIKAYLRKFPDAKEYDPFDFESCL